MIVVLLWTLVSVGWMLISSFKSLTDVLSPTPLLVFKPTLVNYISLVSGGNNILTYFRSSFLAAGISTIIATTLGCFAGYGLPVAISGPRNTWRSGSSRRAWPP
ncbi:hypothetical protein BH18ACT11_BH18ACT11_01050 [soil metagenome]